MIQQGGRRRLRPQDTQEKKALRQGAQGEGKPKEAPPGVEDELHRAQAREDRAPTPGADTATIPGHLPEGAAGGPPVGAGPGTISQESKETPEAKGAGPSGEQAETKETAPGGGGVTQESKEAKGAGPSGEQAETKETAPGGGDVTQESKEAKGAGPSGEQAETKETAPGGGDVTQESKEAKAGGPAGEQVESKEAKASGGAKDTAAAKEAAKDVEGAGAKAKAGKEMPTFTAPAANDASVSQPLPSSFGQTESVAQGAAQAGATAPVASAQAKAAAASGAWETARSVGAAAANIGVATLKGVFVGNWATLWSGDARKGLADQFRKAAQNFSKTTGWEKVAAALDIAYNTVDTIGGFLSPLGTVLSLVSYVRFVPIPPIPAIGAALHVVAQVIKGINFILDVVKLVLSALRPVVDVIGLARSRDPEQRARFRERLVKDAIAFGANGASFALGAFLDKNFAKAYRGAGPGVSRLGKIRAGLKAYGADQWKKVSTVLRPNKIAGMYRDKLKEAWEKAVMSRRLTYTNVTASRAEAAAVHVNRSGAAAVAARRDSLSVLQATGTGKGEGLLRLPSGTLAAGASASSRSVGAVAVGSGGVTAVAGRVRSASAWTLQSSREMDWSRTREVAGEIGQELRSSLGKKAGSEATKKVGAAMSPSPSSGGRGGGPLPPPPPANAVAPAIQPGLDAGAQASQKAVTQPDAKIVNRGPLPPDQTKEAPAHLPSLEAQKEAVAASRKEMESQVAAAKAGQEEASIIGKAAKEHQKGAQGAQGAVQAQRTETAKDQAEVGKEQAKLAAGKAQQAKADGGFNQVKGDATRAQGSVPTGRVNRDEVPWYKRVYLWVVDKFEGAKAKVTQAMVRIIQRVISGVLGLGDVGSGMAAAEQQTQRSQADLAAEPGALGQMEGVAAKEAADASAIQAKAKEAQAANAASEAAAKGALEQAKANEAALEKEAAATKQQAKAYEKDHGPSFEDWNKAVSAEARGDLAPADIRLDKEVQAIQKAVDRLLQDMDQHRGRMEGETGRRKDHLASEAGRQEKEGGAAADAKAQVEQVAGEVSGKTRESHQKRTQEAQALAKAASALGGKAADARAIQEAARLSGQVLNRARQFDQEKAAELRQMHEAFTARYHALFD